MFLVRSRSLLGFDDHHHHDKEHHENNESTNAALYRNPELDNTNDSLVYTEEMKARLEKLLISEDHDIALAKLQEYVKNSAMNSFDSSDRTSAVEDNHVNIIEVKEEYLTTAAVGGGKLKK